MHTVVMDALCDLYSINNPIYFATMTLKLNKILNLKDEEIQKCKLHLAVASDGCEPLDVFSRDFEEWKRWNKHRKNKNDFNREYIFSLITDYHRPGKYLFAGLFQITKRFDNFRETKNGYDIELCSRFAPLVGHLVVDFEKGIMRGRSFCLESFIDNMYVAEITEKPYVEMDFSGL